MAGIIVFFPQRKLLSHMAQIGENINSEITKFILMIK